MAAKKSFSLVFVLRSWRFPINLAHANSIRHPTQRHAASRKLFRDDETRHRAAGKGRGVLLHRQLPFHDVAVRPGGAAQKHADVALDFLACGLDPKKTVFFRQSDVPEVTELTWLLSTMTPMGLLERAHSYKDKIAKGIAASHGLFAYPVLMAADILIYDSNIVPVGRDQKQHVEMTRDIAIKFNEQYGQTFVIPEPQIREEVAVVPGTDGQKMSKSYGNTIEIFRRGKGDAQKNHGHRHGQPHPGGTEAGCRQESRHPTAQARRATGLAEDFENSLRSGGLGYGDLKKALFENYWNYFAEARKKRAELAANLDYVNEILSDGAVKARMLAQTVLKRARKASGLE